eukprot:488307-Pelagomonas_calceolata.AAC.1
MAPWQQHTPFHFAIPSSSIGPTDFVTAALLSNCHKQFRGAGLKQTPCSTPEQHAIALGAKP